MKIGFIGVGLMGRGMVANLQKAGFDLVVHDLSHDAGAPFIEKGAHWADKPQALADACDLVFTSLPTPADVDSVCNGPKGLALLQPEPAGIPRIEVPIEKIREVQEKG